MSLWAGEFGDSYTKRNADWNIDNRFAFWKDILPYRCKSVLEVGANVGRNLTAIESIRQMEFYATEPNDVAREQLKLGRNPDNITADFATRISFPDGVADLVFTCGVLIHIPFCDIAQSMAEIHRCARKWIVCAEYFAPSEEMVPYRGQNDALWRRDYGSLWMDQFPDLKCTDVGFAWKRKTGLDNLTWWKFEK